ncbi:hypothetical protein SAMN05216178_6005 [Pseudomonas saponiphila]|uniref:Uncharacterized protein n=1 Tax=Pseudomonas saponiphila TaxID=556534 RepID=A0A1H4XHS6_9PSED|nr:hypothetical protein [Pseudomonas saponiphila]SED05167.1 hypothetical protein SAMN05216178_6005 [Pseudomonas saponiphila]
MAIPKKTPGRPAGTGAVVFRDSLYTSRHLILPDGRQLPVLQGQVSVKAGDRVALDYLASHPDLQAQE